MNIFKTSTFTSLITATLLAGAAITSPAAASPQSFSYDLQEVQTLSGAQGVLSRLETLARSVCYAESRYSGLPTRATSVCMEDTIFRAVAQIDAACLYQIHAGDLHVETEQSCNAQTQSD